MHCQCHTLLFHEAKNHWCDATQAANVHTFQHKLTNKPVKIPARTQAGESCPVIAILKQRLSLGEDYCPFNLACYTLRRMGATDYAKLFRLWRPSESPRDPHQL